MPTREENIPDHCYTTVSSAYHAVPRAAQGLSDHVMVQLKLKLCKPVVRTSKQWTGEAVEDLQACWDCTDWEVFRTATNSLDEYTEAVTSYISFCEYSCVTSRTRVCYNNDKPWFTAKLKNLRLEKEEAFRRGDRDRYIESKYRFSNDVREAKRLYSEKLQHQFSANDSASVWKGLRLITNCKPRAPHSTNDPRLANDLNDFYCHCERQWQSWHHPPWHHPPAHQLHLPHHSKGLVMILLAVCCSFFPPPLFCSSCAGCVCGKGCGWFLAAADEAHLIPCSPNHPHNKSLFCSSLRCQIFRSCPVEHAP